MVQLASTASPLNVGQIHIHTANVGAGHQMCVDLRAAGHVVVQNYSQGKHAVGKVFWQDQTSNIAIVTVSVAARQVARLITGLTLVVQEAAWQSNNEQLNAGAGEPLDRLSARSRSLSDLPGEVDVDRSELVGAARQLGQLADYIRAGGRVLAQGEVDRGGFAQNSRLTPWRHNRPPHPDAVPSVCPSGRQLTVNRGLTRCPRRARSSRLTRWTPY
jgi:hypothetical protein